MARWDPWRGCHRYSEGCKFCYIHKDDAKRDVDTNQIVRTDDFYKPIARKKNGEYKMKPGLVYVCFSSDFLLEDADPWRIDCWDMIRERQDCQFLFLTKRIERFMNCVPEDWGDGWDNVTVGCTVENQKRAYGRLRIFSQLPIKHKNIICQPMISGIDLEQYLSAVLDEMGPALAEFEGHILPDALLPQRNHPVIVHGSCKPVGFAAGYYQLHASF